MKYYERAEVEYIMSKVFLSKRAIYKRIDKSIEKMAISPQNG